MPSRNVRPGALPELALNPGFSAGSLQTLDIQVAGGHMGPPLRIPTDMSVGDGFPVPRYPVPHSTTPDEMENILAFRFAKDPGGETV